MKKKYSLFLAVAIFTIKITTVNAQAIHVLDFNDSHSVPNTDTTINVSVNDSLVILNHLTLDDDFDYFVNGGASQGAYGIAMNAPIYKLKITNTSVNTIKISCYDANYYRLVTLNYSASGVYDKPTIAFPISVFPNPSNGNFKISHQLPSGSVNGLIQVVDIKGSIVFEKETENISLTEIRDIKVSQGLYFISIKCDNYLSSPLKLIIE